MSVVQNGQHRCWCDEPAVMWAEVNGQDVDRDEDGRHIVVGYIVNGDYCQEHWDELERDAEAGEVYIMDWCEYVVGTHKETVSA